MTRPRQRMGCLRARLRAATAVGAAAVLLPALVGMVGAACLPAPERAGWGVFSTGVDLPSETKATITARWDETWTVQLPGQHLRSTFVATSWRGWSHAPNEFNPDPDALWLGYDTVVVSAGWPLRCLIGAGGVISGPRKESDGPPTMRRGALLLGASGNTYFGRLRVIPYSPLWLGYAINSIVYSCAICGAVVGGGALRRRRAARRLCRGLCPTCAYRMGHSRRCPECGASFQQPFHGDQACR